MKMFFAVVFVFGALASAQADLIAIEDFDSGTPHWGNDAASQTFVDPGSSSQGLFIQSATNTTLFTGNALFGRDITGESGEPSLDPFVLTFDDINISSFLDVALSFDFDVIGFDGGDDVDYQLVLDGVAGASTSLVDGGTGGVSDSGTLSESISDTVSTVGLILTVDQNGSSDTFEFDNFQINGTAAVPEPSAFLFGGLVCSMLGMNFLRRRRQEA